uniref:Uncharacterized protein n=1 Tax=Thermogemmatispora argillosa TaxID=2045280 RepID=A0A455T1Q5_9CHLR|nr:hypothetical protein KTA_19350 [Thermogemmatispora argillosa]
MVDLGGLVAVPYNREQRGREAGSDRLWCLRPEGAEQSSFSSSDQQGWLKLRFVERCYGLLPQTLRDMLRQGQ